MTDQGLVQDRIKVGVSVHETFLTPDPAERRRRSCKRPRSDSLCQSNCRSTDFRCRDLFARIIRERDDAGKEKRRNEKNSRCFHKSC